MKRKGIFILFILLFTISTAVFSQNKELDSLTEILKKHQKKDTVRVHLLTKLALEFYKKDSSKMFSIAEEVNTISDSLNYTKGKASSLFLKGKAYLAIDDFDKSIDYFNQAKKSFQKINANKEIAQCIQSIGDVFNSKDAIEKAHEYYNSALKIYESLDDTDNMFSILRTLFFLSIENDNYKDAHSYANKVLTLCTKTKNKEGIAKSNLYIATTYFYQTNLTFALEYFNKSLDQYKELKDETAMANIYNSLGVLYKALNQYDKAIEYHQKSLEFYKKKNDFGFIAMNFYNIGLIYQKQKKYELAIKNLEESLAIYRKLDSQISIVDCLNGIGSVYIDKKEYNKALTYFNNALKILEEQPIDFKKEKSNLFYGISKAYYAKKEYSKALPYALKTQKIADEIGKLNHQIDAYELLSDIYAKTNNYKKAYVSYKKYVVYYDSVMNQENTRKVAEIEYDYAYKERLRKAKEKEENLSKKVQETNKTLEKSYKYLLWIIITILLLSILFGYYIFKQKLKNSKAENKQILIEQKLLRSQMTPHFVFNSLAVLQGIILNKEYNKSITFLSKFSRLLRLTLENSRNKMVSLESELNAIESYIKLQILSNGIPDTYKITIDDSIDKEEVSIPPMMIQPFIENAIEHGFSKKEKDRHLTIDIQLKKDIVTCIIKDNGIGINAYKKESKKKQSLATTITKERLNIFAKEFKIEATITIRDRKDFGEKGTIVTIVLPHKINTKNLL